MKAVGVIPARIGSTRFPGKMLADLAGKPLIARTIERASLAEKLDAVWLATDDLAIAEVGEALGIKVCMTRADHPSGSDRIAEAVENEEVDLVVNLQGDEPFVDPELLDLLVDRLAEDASCDMATVIAPIRDPGDLTDPAVVKVVTDGHDRALYFSRSTIPHNRDGSVEELIARGEAWRHLGLYGYRKEFLMKFVSHGAVPLETTEKLEQLRALYMGASIGVIRCEQASPGIDTEEDLAKAMEWLRSGELS